MALTAGGIICATFALLVLIFQPQVRRLEQLLFMSSELVEESGVCSALAGQIL